MRFFFALFLIGVILCFLCEIRGIQDMLRGIQWELHHLRKGHATSLEKRAEKLPVISSFS